MAEMTFTIAGGPGVEVHVEEIDGDLRFTVSVLGDGGLTADLRGIFFQLADESLLNGLTLTDDSGAVTEFRALADGVIDLGQGANLQGAASAFDIGVEIGTSGMGRDDYQTATFVLSNDSHDLSLDLIAFQQFGVRLTSVGLEDGTRTDGLKLVGTASGLPDDNEPPVAGPDSAETDEKTAITIAVLQNDSDPDGDAITVSLGTATSALGATIVVNDDGTIAYDPSSSAQLGALNTGEQAIDTFTYVITDAHGATSTATVEVHVAGVTDVVDGFLGKTLDYAYDFRGTVFYNTDVTVTDGVEVADIQGGTATVASLDITNTQLVIDFAAGDSTFASGGFNGIRIQDQFGTLRDITDVRISGSSDLGNMAGFDASDITFTADSIAVNFAGVTYNSETGPHLVLDVFFA